LSSNIILPVPFSNPLAQPWRLPSFDTKRVNRYWRYAQTFTIPAGTTVQGGPDPGNHININGGADFLWREMAFDLDGSLPGKLFARFRDGHGKRLSKDLLSVEELSGPIAISQMLPRMSQLFIDIQNTGAVDRDVQVILKGINLYQSIGINTCAPNFQPEDYVPLWFTYSTPPPGWHDEPFDYYFEISATANQPRKEIPIQMDTDADFYWRGVTGFLVGDGNLSLQWRDAWDNQLSDDLIVSANALGVAPNCRPISPEVCCPAYSTPMLIASEIGGENVGLKGAMRGVKRFKN